MELGLGSPDWWSRLFILDGGVPLLRGSYQPSLVLLSLLVAIVAAIIAFQLAGLARLGHTGRYRQIALITGALVLGVGIWSMHFIGMLAFEICTTVSYDVTWTLCSMIPGLLASWITLDLLSQRQVFPRQLLIGGVLVGAGIGSMHYAGMAAMRMAPQLRFDPYWFAASIVIAVVLAWLALWIRFGLRRSKRLRGTSRLILGGIVMGLAISGMHYAGMLAARFVGMEDPSYVAGSNVDVYMALSVALMTVVVAAIAGAVNGLLRYRNLYLRLRQQQSRTQAIVETAVDGIITIDSRGIVLDLNKAAEGMFGWRADEVIGRNISMLMPEPDRSRHDGYLARYLKHDDARIIGVGREVIALRRDGSLMPMRLAIGRVEMGGPPIFVGFVTDISERHAMEQALRQAKERAEQAAEAKSSFLANMSHEIRTPMNAILGFTDLVLASSLSEEQRRHLSTVRQSARGLLGLINDVLDTAKLERGAVELELKDFSLRELCTQVLDSLSLGAKEKRLFLRLEYEPDLGDYFIGDALRIQQILINLLGNAIKFTEQGGVRLCVGRKAAGEVELAVIDTGIGIAADRIERIFAPFAQADASTTRRFGGTGLGTTIARQLSELMGGRIAVQSALGEGSCFSVVLPLAQGQARISNEMATWVELPPMHILIADDIPQNLELLEIALRRDGHRVTTASDGLQVLACIAEQHPDLVLMDVQMPQLDGLQATLRLREQEKRFGHPRLPVIALTASVLEEDFRAAREAGMDGFATKPLDFPELYAEIARVLGLNKAPRVPLPEPVSTAEAIDWSRGTALWGDRSRLLQALAKFHEAWPDYRRQLTQAIAKGAGDAAMAEAHRLRGLTGNLAMTMVHAALVRLETALKSGDVPTIEQILSGLDQAVAGARPAEWPEGQAVSSAQPADLAQMRERLAHWEATLRRGEMPDTLSREVFASLPGGFAVTLQAALDEFDFERAVAAIHAMLATLEDEVKS